MSRHDTSKVDPILDQARAETDQKKRHDMYCQVAQIISDEAFVLVPIRTTYFAIAQPAVKGLPPMQNSVIRTRAMWVER